MKKYTLILIIGSFLLSACQSNKVNPHQSISLKLNDISYGNLDFEITQAIRLSSGKEHLLGDMPQIKISQNEIYILDKQRQNSILRFDMNGNFLNRIGQTGEGPSEYRGADDFTISNDTLIVLDYSGNSSSLIQFQIDGSFLGKKTINFGAMTFDKCCNKYIFKSGITPGNTMSFYISNQQGVKIDSFLQINQHPTIPFTEKNFNTMGTQVCIYEAFYNDVYSYDGKSFRNSYSIDLEEYTISPEFYNMNLMEGLQLINENGFGIIKNYFENRNLAVFEIQILQREHKSKIHHIVYNKRNKQCSTRVFEADPESKEVLSTLIGLTINDELIFLAYPYQLLENTVFASNISSDLKNKTLNGLKETDNPLIFYVKLK